jgi:hypothetical protein
MTKVSMDEMKTSIVGGIMEHQLGIASDRKESVNPEVDNESDQAHGDNEKLPPNYDVRLKKHLKERDEARERAAALEKRLSELEQERLKESKAKEAQEEIESVTAHMTENEKYLFERAQTEKQELQEKLNKIDTVVSEITKEKIVSSLSLKEERFFADHPHLIDNRDEVSGEILDYLQSRPEMRRLLIEGQADLSEIWGAVSAKRKMTTGDVSSKKSHNSDRVFGSGRQSVGGGSVSDQGDSDWDTARSILRNPDSRDKKAAIRSMKSTIFSDIKQLL